MQIDVCPAPSKKTIADREAAAVKNYSPTVSRLKAHMLKRREQAPARPKLLFLNAKLPGGATIVELEAPPPNNGGAIHSP